MDKKQQQMLMIAAGIGTVAAGYLLFVRGKKSPVPVPFAGLAQTYPGGSSGGGGGYSLTPGPAPFRAPYGGPGPIHLPLPGMPGRAPNPFPGPGPVIEPAPTTPGRPPIAALPFSPMRGREPGDVDNVVALKRASMTMRVN